MIGLLGASNEVYEYAQSVSKYGVSSNRMGTSNAEELTISLRALGSLLASGDWDVPTLQHLRQITPEGSPQSDLYNVLLGRRYEPEMLKLKHDLQNEREARKSEIMNLTARIVQDQTHMHELEDHLKLVQHEHGLRGDELFQATRERDTLGRNLNRTEQEKERYRVNLEKSLQEQQALQAEINQLEEDNTILQQQIKLLRGKTQA